MTRARYQNGCLTKEKRAKGAVWVFRFRETKADGTPIHRKHIVGTVEEYPTRAAAQAAVAGLRIGINKERPGIVGATMSVARLVEHYKDRELTPQSHMPKAFGTTECHNSYLKNWIVPRWGTYRISAVKAISVEEWLAGISLAPGSKAKIRSVMHVLFNHAVRYEWLAHNPITPVRQSAKRVRIPSVLGVTEISALLAELNQLERVIVLVDAVLGIRRGELLGLQWHDIDFDKHEVNVCRSVYWSL